MLVVPKRSGEQSEGDARSLHSIWLWAFGPTAYLHCSGRSAQPRDAPHLEIGAFVKQENPARCKAPG
ncbi:MAG: hypothetical protein Rhims3KO_15100 [Hyphomicrobiales bacterium]